MFPSRPRPKTEIRQGFSEFRPGDNRSRPSWRHSVQGGLEGEDGAQSSADPSRDGHGLGDFFHEQGTCGIKCLLVRNAFTVVGERLVLQAGAEKCCQEEGRRCRCAAPIQLIEALEVCVQQCQATAVPIGPATEAGEKGGNEPALLEETEARSSRSKKEEFLYLLIEPCR